MLASATLEGVFEGKRTDVYFVAVTVDQDIFMAFEDHVDRENWYHLLVEMLAGWQLSQSRIDRYDVFLV